MLGNARAFPIFLTSYFISARYHKTICCGPAYLLPQYSFAPKKILSKIFCGNVPQNVIISVGLPIYYLSLHRQFLSPASFISTLFVIFLRPAPSYQTPRLTRALLLRVPPRFSPSSLRRNSPFPSVVVPRDSAGICLTRIQIARARVGKGSNEIFSHDVSLRSRSHGDSLLRERIGPQSVFDQKMISSGIFFG